MSDEFRIKLEEARRKLPLDTLMTQRGKATGKKCPYCQKDSAGLKKLADQWWWKCFHTSCPTQTHEKGRSWDGVRFLQYELGLSSWKDAAIVLMKEAGVWQEREAYAPSVLPGKAARKKPELREEGNLTITDAIALVRKEKGGWVRLFRNNGAGETRANDLLNVLFDRGILGPPGENAFWPLIDKAGADDSPEEDFSPVPPVDAPEAPVTQEDFAALPTPPPADLPPVARTPNSGEPTPPPGNIVPVNFEAKKKKTGRREGLEVLENFYVGLSWSPADEQALWEKRGLTSATGAALGFRSNGKSNRDFLLELASDLASDECLASGLFKRAKKTPNKVGAFIKPNAQFYGVGRMRKLKDQEAEEFRAKADKTNWVDDDNMLWGWCNPFLIPYFNDKHELISLRPHKGMAESATVCGTPHVYVPRNHQVPAVDECFHTVVITEGEFKAGALWQMFGAGARLNWPDHPAEALGVCALPGINFARHDVIREELDLFLTAVKCRRVIVSYDNEEHGDQQKYPDAYRADMNKRHDAQIWARYLATDLANKLHMRADVYVLPNEWRNEKGKADWDGALAMMAHGKLKC